MFTVGILLDLSQRYCQACGLAEATLSSRLFNDGKRLTEVRCGADIGARRLERAVLWLSQNWPGDLMWPEEVRRPNVTEAAE